MTKLKEADIIYLRSMLKGYQMAVTAPTTGGGFAPDVVPIEKKLCRTIIDLALDHLDVLDGNGYISEPEHNCIIEMIYKQVERGLFCEHITAELALKNIAYIPGSPFHKDSKWNWDVDHKEYAKEFYKEFPDAKTREERVGTTS